MIRSGVRGDIPQILAMGSNFWQQTIYDEPFCNDTVIQMAEYCIHNQMMAVLEIDGKVVGFACGVLGPLLCNQEVKTGTELAWWVEPEYRGGSGSIRLLMYIEKLAKEAGVKYWNMVFMESSMPETIKHIYERLGYKINEVVYSKVLTGD